jgi:sugar phosphate permease
MESKLPMAQVMPNDNLAGEADAVYKRVTWRVMPLILVCYFFGYLDRVNVGFARLQMAKDLGLSDTAYGVGAGLFFVGYLLLQLPAGLLAGRIGTKALLATSLILWGIVSVATLMVRDQTSFYIFRFLLGVTEASFFPGVIAYFGRWFPSIRLGRTMSLLFLAMPLGVIVGGPLSGWIMDATHLTQGLHGWQWMFLIEGTPAIVLGMFLFVFLSDGPADAPWLSESEKALIINEKNSEATDKKTRVIDAVCEPTVWLLFGASFLYNVGNYGLVFWMPTMIKALGEMSNLQVGIISALPYIVASIAMVANARHAVSSRERRWHTALPVLIAGIALSFSVMTQRLPYISLACLSVGVAGIMSTLAMFWSLPSRILSDTAAAGGAGLVNIGAAIAGFVGPSIMGLLKGFTGSTDMGVALLAMALFAAGALILSIPARYMRVVTNT